MFFPVLDLHFLLTLGFFGTKQDMKPNGVFCDPAQIPTRLLPAWRAMGMAEESSKPRQSLFLPALCQQLAVVVSGLMPLAQALACSLNPAFLNHPKWSAIQRPLNSTLVSQFSWI